MPIVPPKADGPPLCRVCNAAHLERRVRYACGSFGALLGYVIGAVAVFLFLCALVGIWNGLGGGGEFSAGSVMAAAVFGVPGLILAAIAGALVKKKAELVCPKCGAKVNAA